MVRRTLALWLVVVSMALALALAACSKSSAADDGDHAKNGAAIYAAMCVSCHGAQGEGGRGPSLRDLTRPEPELVLLVAANMPLDKPGTCRGDCARDVVAYILATFRGPLLCNAPKPAPRGLRLLTRREYRNTVLDLLGGSGAATPCGMHTFAYDPAGKALKSVHVAGSFNGWSQTVAGGGWPLTPTAGGGGKWTLTRQLPPGHNAYKLVVDETTWLVDPAHAQRENDGFGGQNSIVDVSCASGGGGPAVADPTATFPPDTRPEGFAFDDHGPGRAITGVTMDELFRAAGALARTADLAKIAPCDLVANAADCTNRFVTAFGARAFRRPLTAAESERYVKLARGQATGEAGGRAVVRAMLTSSSFLYRSEAGELQPDGTFRLTAHETASALSYMLWGTMPDDELLGQAASGALSSAEGREKQARRLLASPRARETVAVFAEQWLGAEGVIGAEKSGELYPGFDPAVRSAMLEETRRVVAGAFFDSKRGADLFDANYTYLNEALAKHYGIPGVGGPEMRRVNYPDGARAGVLGHGSMLATTGHSDQSSPIRRGLFVRRRLLCQEFGAPPPNAGGVPKVDPNATTRDRFAQHTANPSCKSCHQYIDPVGFGFEEFDTVGRYRTTESGKPIDFAGDMNDVEGFGKNTRAPFANLRELGTTLAASDAGKTCLVKQVYRFARGRIEESTCTVDAIKKRYVDRGGDPQEILIGVVVAPDFVVRQ